MPPGAVENYLYILVRDSQKSSWMINEWGYKEHYIFKVKEPATSPQYNAENIVEIERTIFVRYFN